MPSKDQVTGLRARALCVAVGVAGLVGCDHATKYVAKAELEQQPAQALLEPVLSLRYVENTDIAFNLLSFIPEAVKLPLLLALGAIAIASMLALLLSGRVHGWALGGLLLLLGGALGNYLDRLVRGYVVDFIHVSYWPVFNVADVLVTVGFGLMLLPGSPLRPRSSGGMAMNGAGSSPR
jgi:signal peptidase II